MLLFLLACCFPSSRWISLASASLPRRSLSPQRPSQQLCHGSASLQSRRHGAPASNKPHPTEKSTPVWLAIWRTWAGFANSQHRDAAFATPDNICAHSSLLQTLSSCSDIANLSAHLHRLPTPPPYLRPMRLSPGCAGGVGCRIWLQLGRCGVPANHRAHESPF